MLKLVIFFLFFIIIFIILVLGFFWDDLKKISEKKNHKRHVYKVLHDFVEEKDQLLLNDTNFFFEDDVSKLYKVDHILICDKYVYIIKDYTNFGGIYGNLEDPQLFIQTPNNTKGTIDNPVLENLSVTSKIEKMTKIDHDQHLYVSVVVYNDSLVVPKGVAIKSQNSWFLPLSELIETINIAEEDQIDPLKKESSQRLAEQIKTKSDATKKFVKDSKTKNKNK